MNLPVDFITRTKSLLGDDWVAFVEALNSESPTSIRINNHKAEKLFLDKVLWTESGYYLPQRPSFTFDPLFHAGCYYVQEASSMFIEQAFRQYVAEGKVRILDLCAAPGGKSTLIADIMGEGSLLVSNEVIRTRANILAENITKWGNPNRVVTNNDPQQIGKLQGFFDFILVDAPCSGEGMFRKDEGATSEWSIDNVKLCKERQQRILADIWPALKTEGLLLYSTCTYNVDENEDNVQWICEELGAEVLPIDVKEEWGISPSLRDSFPAYRFFPYKTKGEGFFCALLRKTSDEGSLKRRKDKEKTSKSIILFDCKDYVIDNELFTFYSQKDRWFAFPSHLYNELTLIKSYLNVILEGICLGEVKGKDFIPDQSLALSTCLDALNFTTYDVNWKTAIAYLRKETLLLQDQPKGYILITYKNKPLGFVKNIGNRANNLYPQEWRIRSANIPEAEVNVI